MKRVTEFFITDEFVSKWRIDTNKLRNFEVTASNGIEAIDSYITIKNNDEIVFGFNQGFYLEFTERDRLNIVRGFYLTLYLDYPIFYKNDCYITYLILHKNIISSNVEEDLEYLIKNVIHMVGLDSIKSPIKNRVNRLTKLKAVQYLTRLGFEANLDVFIRFNYHEEKNRVFENNPYSALDPKYDEYKMGQYMNFQPKN